MALWPSALSSFRATLTNEGYTRWMYLDNRGLVTTGQGNLIEGEGSDPAYPATLLPWTNPDGTPASESDIRAAWAVVKARQDLRYLGGENPQFGELTLIRLSDAAISQLVSSVLLSMTNVLETRLPAMRTWPSDGQLALMRWAWANGPNAKYPIMFQKLGQLVPDFDGAAEESTWTNENFAVRVVIMTLFQNAADVVAKNLDPSVLVWPKSLRTSKTDAKGRPTFGGEGQPAFPTSTTQSSVVSAALTMATLIGGAFAVRAASRYAKAHPLPASSPEALPPKALPPKSEETSK